MQSKKHYFGPLLMSYKIDKSILYRLNVIGSTLKTSANTSLAGHLKSQWHYREDTIKWFEEQIQPIFNDYKNNLAVHTNDNTLIKGKFKLNSLWINYMKGGDFNPPHNHTNADVSFVLYIDVPKKLVQEEKEHEGTSNGPGSIMFTINDYFKAHFIGGRTFVPESGQLFIFPAELIHWVFPFKSDVIRTSVAGNLLYKSFTN